MLTFAIVHLRQGSGKTITACRLADALIQQGKSVLLLDLDPDPERKQHLTTALHRFSKLAEFSTHTLYDARDERRVIVPFAVGGAIALISITFDLLEADRQRQPKERLVLLEQFLCNAIVQVYGQESPLHRLFDVCLMKCTSGLNVLTLHAIVAAQSVLIPEIVYPDQDRNSLPKTIMTLEMARSARLWGAKTNVRASTILTIPYDPRLDPSSRWSLEEEDYAAHAYAQDTYWKQLAKKVVARSQPATATPLEKRRSV